MFHHDKCTSSDNSSSIGDTSFQRAVRRCSSAIILGALVAVVALAFVSRAGARPAADNAAGEQAFKTNCAVCHGADGTGTPTGKALKAPDMHSDVVQKMTDQQIADQIMNGKNNMPPFKNTLNKDQIQSLVAYVRSTFGKKK